MEMGARMEQFRLLLIAALWQRQTSSIFGDGTTPRLGALGRLTTSTTRPPCAATGKGVVQGWWRCARPPAGGCVANRRTDTRADRRVGPRGGGPHGNGFDAAHVPTVRDQRAPRGGFRWGGICGAATASMISAGGLSTGGSDPSVGVGIDPWGEQRWEHVCTVQDPMGRDYCEGN